MNYIHIERQKNNTTLTDNDEYLDIFLPSNVNHYLLAIIVFFLYIISIGLSCCHNEIKYFID